LLIQAAALLSSGTLAGAAPSPQASPRATAVSQQYDPPIDFFEDSIKAFETADKIHPPPPNATIFVGSSTFEHWKTLEQEFSQFKAVNRGFGGSTLRECTYYAGRIVTKYRPHRVVLYAGTNDIADNVPGLEVYKRTVAFVQRVRQDMPKVDITIISNSMAPCRVRWEKEFEIANSSIRAFTKREPHLQYIDVTATMRDANGKVRSDLFGADQLHMNAKGYAIWHKLITDALNSFEAQHPHP
jgi:lysophospholipase L1-like esterase